jgi:hypothetical protein
MVRDGGFVQACNAQIADERDQIIVAAALSNQAPDAEYFEPMLRRVVDSCAPSRNERIFSTPRTWSAARARTAQPRSIPDADREHRA